VEEFFSFCLNCGTDTQNARELSTDSGVDAYASTYAKLDAVGPGLAVESRAVVEDPVENDASEQEEESGEVIEKEHIASTVADVHAGSFIDIPLARPVTEELHLDDVSLPSQNTPLPVGIPVEDTGSDLEPDNASELAIGEVEFRQLATLAAMERAESDSGFEIDETLEVVLAQHQSRARCRQCTMELEGDHDFCGHCGVRIDEPAVTESDHELPVTTREVGPVRARLVTINEDGSEGQSYVLHQGLNSVGRHNATLCFESDSYLNPVHADIVIDSANAITVTDRGSLNGTFLRICQPVQLEHGSIFRIGQEVMRFDLFDAAQPLAPTDNDGTIPAGAEEESEAWGRLVQVLTPEHEGRAYLLEQQFVTIGREVGEIVFPDDGYVSSRHATLTRRDGILFLEDLNSSNGTYLRIEGPTELTDGDLLLMGQQLFRIGL
jgi:pSer/pThr/pTyr-binding forkhead associated (FHA) protein